MSLVFGMLSIIAVDAVAVIVIGILKIKKQTSEIESLWSRIREYEEWMDSHERNESERETQMYRTIDEAYKNACSYTDRKFDKSQQTKKQING